MRASKALVPSSLSSSPGALALNLPPEQAKAVRELLADAWSPATRRAYAWGWKTFESWAQQNGWAVWPVPVEAWLLFLEEATRPDAPRSYSSLQTIKAAIGWVHKAASVPSPTAAAPALFAWKGAQARLGTAAKSAKAPLVLEHLRAILGGIDRNTLVGKRDVCILLLGFFAALRRSELVALTCADIKTAPEGLGIYIRRSKTDQEGAGQVVGIQARNDALCPVRAIQEWMKAACITQGRLLRGVHKAGDHGVQVLRPTLDAGTVTRIVQHYAQAIGLDASTFGGHSLRAGLVTEAYRHGAGDVQIMGTTRHKSATMLARYRREADPVTRGVSGVLKDF